MPETISTDQPGSSSETDAAPANADNATPADSTVESGLSAEERAELDRLRAIHKDERKWERRAKENFQDAEVARELKKLFGRDTSEDFDPRAEIMKLRSEVEQSNEERTRADVARIKGVDPMYVVGKTQAEMESAADRYLADVESRVKAALAKVTAPVTESTSTVTSGDRVDGPKQITSEAELKQLSPAEQMAAYKDGRLDGLLGRK